MAITEREKITTDTGDAAVVNAASGATKFTIGAVAVTDAEGTPADAATGTGAVEFLSGATDRYETLLDAAGDAVVIDFAGPLTFNAEGYIKGFRVTPTALAGDGVIGMRLVVGSYT